ncbi:DUF2924 domain-containing protein [Oceanibacterium hippocampi]|uniref:DUF2924 domain-containing protein n=1 Tax=Oceanibacterium hippocampi TaxID=745714 RepID=A0A1Y5TYX4_9PROT|nr:DUF2924 domain-containing protein [Oceanibacterium hippocampi]SLN77036.1 hypothetical protein OCH7691_04255 [Oceanibacterium hippocampi]
MPKPIDEALEALQALDTPALRTRWGKAFKRPPPKHARRDLLLRALAHHVQAQAAGGLRPVARRKLARAAQDLQDGKQATAPPPQLRPGTRLVREWNGETHVVEVLAGGFAWRGATYASLSAIARAITGARWSGPRFFGLLVKRPSGGRKGA